MDDQREHYGDSVPGWANDPPPDPTGLRPCDRAHLAGWVGMFVSLILLGIAIGYGGVLREGPTTGDLLCLAPMGAAIAGYAFAGGYLISRTLTDRAPTGALVLICNAMVVGPFLLPVMLVVVGLLPGCLVVIITTSSAPPAAFWLFTVSFGLMAVLQIIVFWRTGRGLLRFLRAWIDPTGGQWW